MPNEDFDFERYVRETCLELSPPEDPGCCCHLRKHHEGLHECGGCDTTWETSWDWDNPEGYGELTPPK